MKFATFDRQPGTPAVGVVDTERGEVLDLAHAGVPVASLQQLIAAGEEGLGQARTAAAQWPAASSRPLAATKFLAPLPVPQSIRDCLVFETHLLNAMKAWEEIAGRPAAPISPLWFQRPTWYKGNRFSVIGHEEPVQWPPYSKLMDFELELACVIGKKGKDIRPGDALSHVFGFTIFNDISARDIQLDERPLGMGPMKSKDFDTGNIFGPWIVTLDELGDPQDLRMEVRVNGECWGAGNSSDMQHSFANIIAFVSTAETLHPGEIIASGTVGTGCGLEQMRFLKPNDLIELEIDKIGVLRNRIVCNSPAHCTLVPDELTTRYRLPGSAIK